MQRWNDELFLFTREEFKQIPDGTVLTSINGCACIKGTDVIDDDTRFSYMAYGIKDPWNHELKHLFLMFKLVE